MDFRKTPDPKKQLDEAKKCAKRDSKKALSQKFLDAWLDHKLPVPETEYRFHDKRLWRFDYAWPAEKLAVEIDGGSFMQGGHNRGVQQAKDYEKQNHAISLGWRVVRFNTQMLKDVDLCVRHAGLILTNQVLD